MKNGLRDIWRKYWPWISPWQILQGLIAAILLGLAMLVPHRVASDAASALARAIGPLLPWHQRGLDNLAHVYPGMSEAERRQFMDRVWDNLGRNIGEFARLPKVGETVTVSGLENVPSDGTPTIFVTAHMGNWEALTWFGPLCGRDLLNAYRRANNVYVDLLLRMRTHHLPVRMIDKSSKIGIHLLRELRKGGGITLFVDQKGTTGDPLITFLGKEAITVRTPALLAAKTGAVVVPGRIFRKNRHEHHITVYPALPPIAGSGPDAERALLQQMNDVISGWIEETPEQWLWIHRRWKNADTHIDATRTDAALAGGSRQASSA